MIRRISVTLVAVSLCVVSLCVMSSSYGADWPTYLAGNARAGSTDETLKTPLSLRWVYTAPAKPEMAWEGPRNTPIEGKRMRHRVAFDDAIQTVAGGGNVYFGSSVDHKVYCVDANTGQQKWTYFTGGPIRLAPTLHDGRLYVGSDDGLVYCFDAADGRVVWKQRVADKDERLLARGRMISRWPVRTGVLIDKGVAYFGAGVFPHETIYLCAADAKTGKFIWRNDAISQRDAGRDDLTPQGYLLCNSDLLFVPSGRTLPVAFDKKTGRPVHRRKHSWRGHAGGVIGGAKALLVDDQLFTAGPHHFLAMNQKTGDIGNAWLPGRQMVVTGDRAYLARAGTIIAVDRAANAKASRGWLKLKLQLDRARRNKKLAAQIRAKMDKVADVGIAWKTKLPHESALIRAGELIIAGGDNKVSVLNAADGKTLWETDVDGAARGLVVANRHLVVSTDQGKIYCYSASSDLARLAVVGKYPKAPVKQPYAKDEQTENYQRAAAEIIKRTGVKAGFCLVVGSEQGRLAYELAKQTKLTIVGVESNPEKLAAARKALDAAGLYGSRISLLQSDIKLLPLANYFADLVVSDTALLTGKLPGEAADISRHVRPCGGKVCFGSFKAAAADPKSLLDTMFLKIDVESIKADKQFAVLTRAPLPGAGQWSHQYGNVGNTSLSNDHRVKGGLGVLWYGDPGPSAMVNRHAAAAAPLSTNGRMFIQGTDKVMAYDAYNGRFLWQYKNPGAIRTGVFNNNETSNLAADKNALYVAVNDTCTALDTATGKIIHTHRVPKSPDGVPRAWGYVAVDNGLLFGTSTVRSELAKSLRRRGRVIKSDTDAVFAVEPKTGKARWIYRGQNILHTTIAIDDGRMFFIDSSLTPDQRRQLYLKEKPELKKLTGEEAKKAEAKIKKLDVRLAVALDAKTGEKLWERPVEVTNATHVSAGGGNLAVMVADGHVVLCGANANGHYWRQFLSGKFNRRRLVVLSAENGDTLWSKDANYMNRPLIVGQEIIAEPWAYDLATGKEKMRRHPITGEQVKWQFSRPGHHCGIITATPNMMLFRSGFIGYYDLYSDSGTKHFGGQRLGCWINAIPGNGLVMIPEASAGCVCLFSIASTVVLEPREDRHAWAIYSAGGARTPVNRLAINFAAPGDRRDEQGQIWFGYPRPRSSGRLEYVFDLKTRFAKGGRFVTHGGAVQSASKSARPWIDASWAQGISSFVLPLRSKDQGEAKYTLRLYLASPSGDKPGERTFDVKLQGKTVADNVGAQAKVFTLKDITVETNLQIEIASRGTKPPAITGLEVTRQDE
jgi:outer membrane protein assembly factor BamB